MVNLPMVIVSPLKWGCGGPLPNGRTPWLMYGDYKLLTSPGMILQVLGVVGEVDVVKWMNDE